MNTYPFNGCYDVMDSMLQVVIFIISSKQMLFIKKWQYLFGSYYTLQTDFLWFIFIF